MNVIPRFDPYVCVGVWGHIGWWATCWLWGQKASVVFSCLSWAVLPCWCHFLSSMATLMELTWHWSLWWLLTLLAPNTWHQRWEWFTFFTPSPTSSAHLLEVKGTVFYSHNTHHLHLYTLIYFYGCSTCNVFKVFDWISHFSSLGWFVDQTGSYTMTFLLSGISLICSAVILGAVRFILHCTRGRSCLNWHQTG